MIEIFTDGASRGNPGKSASAFIIIKNDAIIYKDAKYIGEKTNNLAEYEAIILALEKCVDLKFDDIVLYSDSNLVISQINGYFKVKNINLQRKFMQVYKLKNQFTNIKFVHIRRNEKYIPVCDMMVNETLNNC